MPRPAYIVCCESSAVDRASNLVSHFNVLEKVTAHLEGSVDDLKKVKLPVFEYHFRLFSVWMRSDDDGDEEFEAQLSFVDPAGNESEGTETQKFSFRDGKPLFRLMYEIPHIAVAGGAGVYRAISKVRRASTKGEWLTQEYPFILELIESTTVAGETKAKSRAPVGE